MFSFRFVTTVNDRETGIPKTAYASGNERGFALFDMCMIMIYVFMRYLPVHTCGTSNI